MPKIEDIQHSILIVSAVEQFETVVRKTLPPGRVMSVDTAKSAAAARRCVLERYYDIVVINAPLPDEPGTDFALDVTEQCHASVLLVVPQEMYQDIFERVTDCGILALAKPFPKSSLNRAIRYLMAVQRKIHVLEKKVLSVEEKMEELRIVNRAKLLLIEKKHMTEDDAHRFIGKQAMDSGISRKRAAQRILEELE